MTERGVISQVEAFKLSEKLDPLSVHNASCCTIIGAILYKPWAGDWMAVDGVAARLPALSTTGGPTDVCPSGAN